MMTLTSRILAFLRIQRIRNRVLLAMIVISVPPLFILGYVSFNTAKETLLETNMQTNEDHLRTSSEVAELMFLNIKNLNSAIVLDEMIRDDLRLSTQVSGQEHNELRKKIQSRMQRVMNNNFIDSRFVDSICLLNRNVDAYCLGRSDDAGKYEGSDKQNIVPQEKWYQMASEAQGKVVFLGYNVLDNNRDSFSSIKLYRDSSSIEGKTLGVLIVNISSSMFERIFDGSQSFGGTYLAVDTSVQPAKVIYAQESGLPAHLEQGNLDSIYAQLKSRGYLVSTYQNDTTQWMFLHAIKEKILLNQSNKIGTFTFIIASIIALAAVLISYFLSGGITRSLIKLKKMMMDWTKGVREFEEITSKDEVSVLGSTFKRIAFENEELNQKLLDSHLKERDAELRVLQAQINPHFLYNTLDSIYWMAMLDKNQKIAKMAISLSKSFKLSLNKGKKTIPVYKELMHIEHYLTIQNIRYNQRFTYEQDVEDSIMGIEIMKLLLQPLVENAITHGLEPKIGRGTLRLTGSRDGEFIIFLIEDDGVGIEDMERTEQGFGLRNVRERLTLYYGHSSSLEITSEKGIGTKVRLRFKPFEKELSLDAQGIDI